MVALKSIIKNIFYIYVITSKFGGFFLKLIGKQDFGKILQRRFHLSFTTFSLKLYIYIIFLYILTKYIKEQCQQVLQSVTSLLQSATVITKCESKEKYSPLSPYTVTRFASLTRSFCSISQLRRRFLPS